MADGSNSSGGGAQTLLGALIIAAAVVGGAFVISGSLQSTTTELGEVRTALVDLQESVKDSAGARPAPSRAANRPRRPDATRRYTLDIEGAPVKGSETAQVTVVEFSDFQCPFCARVNPTMAQIEDTYGDQVKIAFKHLPLRIHPNAPAAHAASVAAQKQGKFWEMHDLIFANQRELSEEQFLAYAVQLELDQEQFKADSVSAETKARVAADQKEAERLGVSGTPAFFINGKYLSGAQPFDAFKAVIDEELKAAKG